jgi:hypothetical protein
MNRIWPLLIILGGCSTFYLDTADLLRANNLENISKLSPGMDKALVMRTMGTEPSRSIFMWIDNPYRVENTRGKNERTYEVLYYYTDMKHRDDKITDDELTPVILENGKLIGVGYAFLNQHVP